MLQIYLVMYRLKQRSFNESTSMTPLLAGMLKRNQPRPLKWQMIKSSSGIYREQLIKIRKRNQSQLLQSFHERLTTTSRCHGKPNQTPASALLAGRAFPCSKESITVVIVGSFTALSARQRHSRCVLPLRNRHQPSQFETKFVIRVLMECARV